MKQNKEFKIIFILLLLGILLILLFSMRHPAKQETRVENSEQKPQSTIHNPIFDLRAALNTVKAESKSIKVPVLMYHHVGYLNQPGIKDDKLARDLTVSPEDFESQVKYFKSLGYHTVSLSQVYESLEN